MAWFLVATVFLSGVALLIVAHRRVRKLLPLREAAPGTSIEELSDGRFRVTGKIVGIHTTPSAIDRMPCVYVETAEYRTVGSELVPFLREVGHRHLAHPFFVDDGTGRVLVDPAHSLVDTVTLREDEGLLVERRLREGEEVEVVATFAPTEFEGHLGPYRANSRLWEAVDDAFAPPRVSFRADASDSWVLDDTVMLLRGSGWILLSVSLVGTALGALI